MNSLINKLPFELHLPGGYQYCGPGTKLRQRLQRGDPGINELDRACKQHDIEYSLNDSLVNRHEADHRLEKAAWERLKAKNSKFGEKLASLAVASAMRAKRKLGMGMQPPLKRPRLTLAKVIRKAKLAIKHMPKSKNVVVLGGSLFNGGANAALIAAKTAVKEFKKGRKRAGKVAVPRVIALPKTGGILPLLPIFAALSALGSIAGGAAGIVKSVRDTQRAREELEETKRHNKSMEEVAALSKTPVGKGLFLRPYKKGLGVFIDENATQVKPKRQIKKTSSAKRARY